MLSGSGDGTIIVWSVGGNNQWTALVALKGHK
jgi:hypothetical protein